MKRIMHLLLAICSLTTLESFAFGQDLGGIFRYSMEATSDARDKLENANWEERAIQGTNVRSLSEAWSHAEEADLRARKGYFMPDHDHLLPWHITNYWRFHQEDCDLAYRWLVSYIESTQRSSRVLDDALEAAWIAKQRADTAYQLALLFQQYNVVTTMSPISAATQSVTTGIAGGLSKGPNRTQILTNPSRLLDGSDVDHRSAAVPSAGEQPLSLALLATREAPRRATRVEPCRFTPA